MAASDYVRAVPDMIRQWVPGRYTVLGTDGYGRSDGREALRRHFEVNRFHIAVAALDALAAEGKVKRKVVAEALVKYGIDADKPNPLTA